MTKSIPLTKNQFGLVPDNQYERLSQVHWCALWIHGVYYAGRNVRVNGKSHTIYMADEIMQPNVDQKVEFINPRDTLNLTYENMRLVPIKRVPPKKQTTETIARPVPDPLPVTITATFDMKLANTTEVAVMDADDKWTALWKWAIELIDGQYQVVRYVFVYPGSEYPRFRVRLDQQILGLDLDTDCIHKDGNYLNFHRSNLQTSPRVWYNGLRFSKEYRGWLVYLHSRITMPREGSDKRKVWFNWNHGPFNLHDRSYAVRDYDDGLIKREQWVYQAKRQTTATRKAS